MGTQDRNSLAFPSNHIKGRDYSFYTGNCAGGRGGGNCAVSYSGNFFWWSIRVSPVSIYNRRLVLQNILFQLWANAGADGSGCSATYGALTDYKLYLGYTQPTSNTPPNTTYGTTISASNIPPTSYTFDNGSTLPQPTDPRYDGHIYVTIALPYSNMVTPYTNPVANTVVMITTNLDTDSRL